MKRVNLVILLAILFGLAMNQPASAQGKDDFVLKKGKIVDYNRDGTWDFIFFTLKQKDPDLNIPVTKINMFNTKFDFTDVPFVKLRMNKRKTLYIVDLRGLGISGGISMEAFIDTSELPPGSGGSGEDSDAPGKPGGPKETVIIVDYP